ncbi:MAG: SAF domain-containing protein [Patescibacteria group bacterium]|nr:SAF domain-containing protein [Patescibacteria group bacterium]
MKDWAQRGYTSVSDNTDLIQSFENKVVLEATGTISYGVEVALKTIESGKHLVTMNPELQATLGSKLLAKAREKGVYVTDVVGDQPGSLARLITHAQFMGFRIRLAGNMKRYLDRHATQVKMKPWADDKGLAVRQTVSFTDGTKQCIEMTLVANYFGMDILQFGMKGPQISDIHEALHSFPWEDVPEHGVVDYVIGKTLFPGVFVIAEHLDPHQKKYLRYLNLGEGPRYVLFDAYHLCHLEVWGTIAKLLLLKTETINNTLTPRTTTIAVAKFDLKEGTILDGIGGDTIYGNIDRIESADGYLPIGIAEGAIVKRSIHQDQPIRLEDIELPDNPAIRLWKQ